MTVSHYYWITHQCHWRLNQLTKREQQQSEEITPSTWQQHHKNQPIDGNIRYQMLPITCLVCRDVEGGLFWGKRSNFVYVLDLARLTTNVISHLNA